MYIKIKVTPGAKKEMVKRISRDHYEMNVREKAEGNKANTRILELCRNIFPMSIIRIVSGHHSPHKILSVEEKKRAS